MAFPIACNVYDGALSGASPSDDASRGGTAGAPPGSDAGGSSGGTMDDASLGTSDVSMSPDGTIRPGVGTDGALDAPGSFADALADGGAPAEVGDARAIVDVTDAPVPTESLIDDMEDGDEGILIAAGRRGPWFVLNDGTPGAVQTPAVAMQFTMTAIPGARGASTYAAHTAGQGFMTYSAVFGFWLNKLGSAFKQQYDASAYTGVTFWARLGASDSAALSRAIRVILPDHDTDPDGQVCTDAAAGCFDHFGKNITLTPDWVKYTIRFSELQQSGFGFAPPGFDAAHMYGVEFSFPLAAPFDCWIDDIAFTT